MERVNKKLKIALYARVSTLLNQDPELQLIQLRQQAMARGFVIVGEFVDRGISGSRESRPALDNLIRQARLREFDLIGVTALDRLGRNTKHMLTLMDELKHLGVAIISLREGIEMNSPMGQMIMTVISAIAQLERSLISERIKNALAAKKLAAEKSNSDWRCGRPILIDENLTLKVNELRGQGQTIRAIAKNLGVSKTTVGRILSLSQKGKISGGDK